MRKKYGLLSLIFGIVSFPGIVLQFPPFLAVLFAVLYKAKGDPKDKKQHRYARIGAVMGSLTLGMVFGAWFMVLFPGEGVLHGFLLVLIYLGTLVLCLWLYERNWNKPGKAMHAHEKTEAVPGTTAAPAAAPSPSAPPVDSKGQRIRPLVLLQRERSSEEAQWTELALHYQNNTWQLHYHISKGDSGSIGSWDLPENLAKNPAKEKLLDFIQKARPDLSMEGIEIPPELRFLMEQRQGFPFPSSPEQKTSAPSPKAAKKSAPKTNAVPSSEKASFTLSPLAQPAHSGEVEHGFYLVREHGKWNIEHRWAFAKPGDTTKYGTELLPLPANFFHGGSLEQLRTFIRRETGITPGPFHDERKIKKLFVPAPITAPFAAIREHDFTTSVAYLQELFETDMESWVYIDYVALDARNGKAYFVHSEVRHVSGAYGSEEYFRELTYDQVREEAKKHGKAGVYDRLSADTWQDFITQDTRNKIARYDASHPVSLEAARPKGKPITEFYMELHNMHAHSHVWLRKTAQGYRIFYITSHGWHYGLSFRFEPTEEMVSRVLGGEFGHRFDAYDRLLKHQEADAVLALAQKTPENPRPLPKYVSGYYTDGILKRAIDSGHWQTFGYTLEKIAQHGCDVALKQEVSQ